MFVACINHADSIGSFNFNSVESGLKRSIAAVSKVSQRVFQGLCQFTVFPYRYIGSKTWSIPGIIIRAPYFGVKKILGLSTNNDTLLGSGYHYQFQKQLTKEEVKGHLEFISMAAFAHTSQFSWVQPFGYKLISPKSLGVEDSNLQIRESCFFDPESGLKVVVAEKGNDIVVSFGAMDSSKSEILDSQKSRQISRDQWLQGATNLLGRQVPLAIQAEIFFKKLIESSQFKDKNIKITGQCLGGCLAQFVSLKHHTKSYCYNSLQLGAGLQLLVDADTLQNADEYVTHVSAKGDYLTDGYAMPFFDKVLSSVGVRTPGNFGKRFFIPSAYKDSMKTHNFMLGSAMKYLGFPEKTHPKNITEFIQNS